MGIPTHVCGKENQVADELANLGVNWRGPDLHCNAAQDWNHPILQQCIRKAAMVDTSPDGVSNGLSWQEADAGTGRRGMETHAGHVP